LDALDETDYCLSAGGDLVCHTVDPARPAWQIGIENPHDTMSLIAVVPVRSGAVATSGTAHRGSHLVDPRTGQHPSAVASATVIADSLTWADIDATAAYIQGRHAVRWLETRPIRSALIVWADGTATRLAKQERTRFDPEVGDALDVSIAAESEERQPGHISSPPHAFFCDPQV
jgi:thiamine biosynthesis lipoprotein